MIGTPRRRTLFYFLQNQNQRKKRDSSHDNVHGRENKRTSTDYFLWASSYDRKNNKVVFSFYVPQRGMQYVDAVGMKPFLITNAPRGLVEKILNTEEVSEGERRIKARELVVGIEEIELTNRLYMRKQKFTKIYTKTPGDIPKLRDFFDFGEYYSYESDVKYHRNAVIEFGIVPFTPTKVQLLAGRLRVEQEWRREDAFDVLEAEIPIPDYIAFDIEVLNKDDFAFPNVEEADDPVILISASARDATYLFVNCEKMDCNLLPAEIDGAKVKKFENETEMIKEFFNVIKRYHLVVTFNGDGFDVPYLCNRLRRLSDEKCPFEPLMVYTHPLTGDETKAYDGKGFMHLDLFPFLANPSVKGYTFEGRYEHPNLDDIATGLLGYGKTTREPVFSMWKSGRHLDLAKYSVRDAKITREVFEWGNYTAWKALVLFSRIAKLPPFETARTTIQTWITQLMLWMHRKTGAVFPSKREIMSHEEKIRIKSESKTGKKFGGAIVFDLERRGLYWNVAVLDFASLYPTIIIKHNVSYETVNPLFECNEYEVVPDVGHRICKDVRGMFSQVIETLRDLRVHKYKKLAKDKSKSEKERAFYDAIQMSLKVFINASYGVNGSESFKLFTPVAAETVTAYGRYYITKAKQMAEEMGFKVIYGDTDSLFLLVREGLEGRIDELIKRVADELGMEIELDKWFAWVGFHAKKNYVGLTKDGKLVLKGMMGKKRDTPEFIRRKFAEALDVLKAASDRAGMERAVGEVLRIYGEGRRAILGASVDPSELSKSASLSKNPDEYDRAIPHVVAARLAQKLYGVQLRKGDVVRYVKGKNGYVPIVAGKKTPKHLVDWLHYAKYYDNVFEQLLGAIEAKKETGLMRFTAGRTPSGHSRSTSRNYLFS